MFFVATGLYLSWRSSATYLSKVVVRALVGTEGFHRVKELEGVCTIFEAGSRNIGSSRIIARIIVFDTGPVTTIHLRLTFGKVASHKVWDDQVRPN